eukprot:2422193-Amphidinium_carterae.1
MAAHPKLSFHNFGCGGNPSQVVIPTILKKRASFRGNVHDVHGYVVQNVVLPGEMFTMFMFWGGPC